ncbi:MAG: hypothetical protein JJU45_17975 [Acidimicrobiia bacterium]|nr:hypothetical protein [Acidimicrobiia bacterium]
MASSKKAKKRKARRRAHAQRVEKHETKAKEKPHEHLPHSGTPANDEYLLKRSRQDLVGFGEFRRSRGPWPTILAVAAAAMLAIGVLAWVLTIW